MPESTDSCAMSTGPNSALPLAASAIARVGWEAPDFEADAFVSSKGFTRVKLSDYRRRKCVVLCFHPGDFTFVCSTELAALAARYEQFKTLGIEVLSMSTDSRFVHKVWQEHELSKMIEGGYPFPMLSDPGGKIGRIYGVYDEAAGVDIRGRFIIDSDFTVRAIEILTPEVGRNPDELIRQIKALQHVRATGEVTPSGWQPGQPALKPSISMVGKVWQSWKP
jgi:alkyl hydroperoxide reductase subunit AhpC